MIKTAQLNPGNAPCLYMRWDNAFWTHISIKRAGGGDETQSESENFCLWIWASCVLNRSDPRRAAWKTCPAEHLRLVQRRWWRTDLHVSEETASSKNRSMMSQNHDSCLSHFPFGSNTPPPFPKSAAQGPGEIRRSLKGRSEASWVVPPGSHVCPRARWSWKRCHLVKGPGALCYCRQVRHVGPLERKTPLDWAEVWVLFSLSVSVSLWTGKGVMVNVCAAHTWTWCTQRAGLLIFLF